MQHAVLFYLVKSLTLCQTPDRSYYSQWGLSGANGACPVTEPALPLFGVSVSMMGLKTRNNANVSLPICLRMRSITSQISYMCRAEYSIGSFRQGSHVVFAPPCVRIGAVKIKKLRLPQTVLARDWECSSIWTAKRLYLLNPIKAVQYVVTML